MKKVGTQYVVTIITNLNLQSIYCILKENINEDDVMS